MALLHAAERAIDRGLISKQAFNRLLEVFITKVLQNNGERPGSSGGRPEDKVPLFTLISPTGRCNLRCKGCYAESDPGNHASLDFETFDRIITEKRELWGSHFTVISGGEPFLWRDGPRGLLDIVERHPAEVFMAYTNATLITDRIAKRMGELGNITPAVSVEGFAGETDDRRGKGVHAKILQAFEFLRQHGVPFGISATPTRYNWETITSDGFIDFYFEQEGAAYGWLFQYMPIGRGQSFELVVPPPQRVEMLRRVQRIVVKRNVFLADFWNNGSLSNGCISAGRPGGYFYIDWNGDISPCAFVPYSSGNIYDIYARGGTLDTALESPLFREIRKWQFDYGFDSSPRETDNWLCPCVIRDHFEVLKEAVIRCGSKPLNEEAAIALRDDDYHRNMVRYGEEMKKLTDSIWKSEYREGMKVGA
ncbi:MAG: radical SAM protein [Candidatus Krumholzibacteriota bacterium]|nr:radical SAM protein [Candidatus Krumholzibacteriota bacterium]